MFEVYGNEREYDKFWLYLANAMPSYLDFLYLQQWNDETSRKLIAKFPEDAARWIKKNCPLDWVRDQINIKV